MNTVLLYVIYVSIFMLLSIFIYFSIQYIRDKRAKNFLSFIAELSNSTNQSSFKENKSLFPDIVLDIKLVNDVFLGKNLQIDISTLLLQIVEQVQHSSLPPSSIVIVRSASINEQEVKFGFDILSVGEIRNGS